MTTARGQSLRQQSGERTAAAGVAYLALVSIGGLLAVALNWISPWVWLGVLATTFVLSQLWGRRAQRNGRARQRHAPERVLDHHQ